MKHISSPFSEQNTLPPSKDILDVMPIVGSSNPLASLVGNLIANETDPKILSRFRSEEEAEKAQQCASVMAQSVLENINQLGHTDQVSSDRDRKRDFYFALDEPVHLHAHQQVVEGITGLPDYQALRDLTDLTEFTGTIEDVVKVGKAVLSVDVLTHTTTPDEDPQNPNLSLLRQQIAGKPFAFFYHVALDK